MRAVLKINLIVIFFLNFNGTKSQDANQLQRWDTLYVGTSRGVVIRKQPTIKGEIVSKIPFGTKVAISMDDFHKVDPSEFKEDWNKFFIQQPVGWAYTKYDGKAGYVFTGFLTQTKISKRDENDSEIQILFEGNFCLGELIYDPGFYWYSVYLIEEEHFNYSEIKIVKIDITTYSENSDGGNIFISTDFNKRSKFLIGLKKQIKEGIIGSIPQTFDWHNSRSVSPGEKLTIGTSNSYLFAFGCSDSIDKHNTPVIRDYRLFVSHENQSQELTHEFNYCLETSYDIISWYGDINGDKCPEILTVQGSTQWGESKFFMSSKYFNDSSNVVKNVSVFKYFNCH